MSREIKFRAWCIESKRFITLDGQNTFEIFEDDDFVLIQYTGLKDKNGKEIYEGDVVQESLWIDGNFITNCIKVFTVIYQGVSFQYQPIVKSNHTVNPIGTTVEIIGNIYENPELLNNKE